MFTSKDLNTYTKNEEKIYLKNKNQELDVEIYFLFCCVSKSYKVTSKLKDFF